MLLLLFRQLSGLVVECWPTALKAGVQTPDEEPKNFHYRLSSAETQELVDRMYSVFHTEASKRPLISLNE